MIHSLDLSFSEQLEDVSDLQRCTNLVSLDLHGCEDTYLTPV